MYNFARQDVLKLLPMLILPDIVRDGFVTAGIVNKTIQTVDTQEITQYEFNIESFKNIPDRLLSALYHELKCFCSWHKEVSMRINETDTPVSNPIAIDYEKCRQFLFTCSYGDITILANTLSDLTSNFIKQFTSQWRKYQ